MEHFCVKLEIFVQVNPSINYKSLNTHTYIYMFNFNAAIHMPTCRLTGQQPTQKSYKKHFLLQKECSRPCDFRGTADKVGQAYHTCITF